MHRVINTNHGIRQQYASAHALALQTYMADLTPTYSIVIDPHYSHPECLEKKLFETSDLAPANDIIRSAMAFFGKAD